jgi:hypothetical protein
MDERARENTWLRSASERPGNQQKVVSVKRINTNGLPFL